MSDLLYFSVGDLSVGDFSVGDLSSLTSRLKLSIQPAENSAVS